MIEKALLNHLRGQTDFSGQLATYSGVPAIFNQEAPADTDKMWKGGPQYPRCVFVVDLQGDPERLMGGTLAVDMMCLESGKPPEEFEPMLRALIHGYFFSKNKFVAAAQWKGSSYFTQPEDKVLGVTITFDLLAFPKQTTAEPDPIARLNRWTGETFEGVYVINHDKLPAEAWTPTEGESAVYWRKRDDKPARWVPDTFHTIWRTMSVAGHLFTVTNTAGDVLAENIRTELYASKRLFADEGGPIMVNTNNAIDPAADPLRTGQLTVEATYGIIVSNYEAEPKLWHVHKKKGRPKPMGKPEQKPIQPPVKPETPDTTPDVPVLDESVYTVEELVANYRVFGTYKEIVAVALLVAGVKTATFAEAKVIVDDFKKKEA